MEKETTKVGKGGTVVIPAGLRRKYGFEEGALVDTEGRPEGVLLRPVVTLPFEKYPPNGKRNSS
jgi:AbrB family looped-hinge helix DNA binding protein